MQWVQLILGGVITGLTVALIEETFLRGAMQTAITRESGARARHRAHRRWCTRPRISSGAIASRRPTWMPAAASTCWRTRWRCSRSRSHILDAFLCLVAVGVLLGMVRVLHRQHRRIHRPARRLGRGHLRGARNLEARAGQPAAPGCSANSTASSAGWCSPGRWSSASCSTGGIGQAPASAAETPVAAHSCRYHRQQSHRGARSDRRARATPACRRARWAAVR